MSADLAAAIATLHRITRDKGTGWRRNTPPEVVAAIDDVLRAWRKAQR